MSLLLSGLFCKQHWFRPFVGSHCPNLSIINVFLTLYEAKRGIDDEDYLVHLKISLESLSLAEEKLFLKNNLDTA